MSQTVLKGKRILAVDDEMDILDILDEELEDFDVIFDRAVSYEEAMDKIAGSTYDAAILDIMGVRGFELLEFAAARKLPVVMLTAHSLSPASLKKSIELGARAYLPKDQIGQIGPFIEDVLTLSYHSGWASLLNKLGASFGKRFGPDWRKSEKEFWAQFEQDMTIRQSVIIQS